MLCFCKEQIVKPKGMNIVVAETNLLFDKDIWQNGKRYFKNNICRDVTFVYMMPVVDDNEKLICYAWQDEEANRELRMIEELMHCNKALQFKDIYSDIQEVVIYGCNELSYWFVKYLETQHIRISVIGEYWRFLGYENIIDDNICYGEGRMVILAEDFLHTEQLCQKIIDSASARFECIDRIYETNVIKGYIKDSDGNLENLLEKLRMKKVVILGIDTKSQDAYDFLFAHGIEIFCFASWRAQRSQTLLGKRVINIGTLMSESQEWCFVGSMGSGSALGTRDVEFFDYYGYKRNKQYFLMYDYTGIPNSNLVHVLREKTVILAGDEALCKILACYLQKVEENMINIRYLELSELDQVGGDVNKIVCIVSQRYGPEVRRDVASRLEEKLKELGINSYTSYFSSTRAFVIADEYLNRNKEKYSIKSLRPGGILLGEIPASSGNRFVKGVLDGHPNILQIPYMIFSSNMFFYCIQLSRQNACNIMSALKKVIVEDVGEEVFSNNFPNWETFQKSAENLLKQKTFFSSQELFVIFHIAYTEMINGKMEETLSSKILYWDPHWFPRNEMSFLAKWLESEEINGQTLVVRRDNTVWWGSYYKFSKKGSNDAEIANIRRMFQEGRKNLERRAVECTYWGWFTVRFEDIKLHPKEELMKICDRMRIPWSDTMMFTSEDGKKCDFFGMKTFSLKPVFNKYEEFFSEFDRLRIAIINSSYQKKYGYVYENCMEFSRLELWEMFLKKFRFQQKLLFTNETEKTRYYLTVYEIIRWQLWNTRKSVLLDDIIPEFGIVEIDDRQIEKNGAEENDNDKTWNKSGNTEVSSK